jgi:serine/threonine-protein kinase
MAHVHRPPPPLPVTVPVAVQAAIAEALSKDPADRPRDGQAFAAKLRRLQLATMPPPGIPGNVAADPGQPTMIAAIDQSLPLTQVMGDGGDGSQTTIMPEGSIVSTSPDLGMSQQPYAARRQRRRLGFAALATVIAVVAFVQLTGDGAGPINPTTTTAPAVTSATIDANVLLGLPLVEASGRLSGAGFVVTSKPVDAPGIPAGIVTGVEPSGQVPSGATVTLNVSNGNIASPTTTATTVAQTGNSHGNGKKKPKG